MEVALSGLWAPPTSRNNTFFPLESCRFFWSRGLYKVWTRMATAMRGEAKNGCVRKHMEDCSLLKKIKATCVQQIFHKVTFGHYLLPQKIDALADLPGSQ